MSEKPTTEIEVERRYSAGEFMINADRRQTAFCRRSDWLSHGTGSVQWILTRASWLRNWARNFLKAAEFCSYKTLTERYPKKA